MAALVRLLRELVGRAAPADPFTTLEVQLALSRLDREINDLLHGPRVEFAQGHHLIAAIGAYDQALDDACRLAGVPPPDAPTPVRRLLAEAELRSRGWDW